MVIGITGGIGAGKSAATDYLRAKGYAVVDADEVAREAVRPGEPALAALVAAFGPGILRGDGTLDRARLARLVFTGVSEADGGVEADAASGGPDAMDTEDRTRRLNGILHGDIKRRIEGEIEGLRATRTQGSSAPVFISAPLLFESGLDGICDVTLLVVAPEELRIARAAARDGLPAEDIRARAACQMSEEEKRARADVIIENTGSPEALYRKLDKLLAPPA